MLNVKFENITIKIPCYSTDISFGKGLNINYIWNAQEHNRDTKLEILDIIYPSIIWKTLNNEALDNIIDQLEFTSIDKIKNLQFFNTFKLKGKYYGIHKLDILTLREYMDIEFHLTLGDSPLDELDKIVAIMFRPIVHKNNNIKNIFINIIAKIMFKVVKPVIFKDYTIEYYDKQLENSELFKENFTYSMGLGAIISYNMYKKQLMEEFPYLFSTKNTEYDPFAEQEKEYIEEHKEEIEVDFVESWGFYHILNELVPTLSEQELWYDKDVKQFMKYLVYVNQKNEYNNSKNNNQT